jgi:hypothetical protein
MPAFRSYIFHEAIKPWLEVMVWSSARPHNVDKMVDRCFGDRREELKAVWARDTLGLAEDDYCVYPSFFWMSTYTTNYLVYLIIL